MTVGNSETVATSGTVTVTDTLPSGLRADRISGPGWTCDQGTLTCTRSDALPAGSSYPPITLKVDVSCRADDAVINTATVTGGAATPLPPTPPPTPPRSSTTGTTNTTSTTCAVTATTTGRPTNPGSTSTGSTLG
ncbi:hypothetical protein ACWC9T_40630 [Kitasatospora sp. NPDC001159]